MSHLCYMGGTCVDLCLFDVGGVVELICQHVQLYCQDARGGTNSLTLCSKEHETIHVFIMTFKVGFKEEHDELVLNQKGTCRSRRSPHSLDDETKKVSTYLYFGFVSKGKPSSLV